MLDFLPLPVEFAETYPTPTCIFVPLKPTLPYLHLAPPLPVEKRRFYNTKVHSLPNWVLISHLGIKSYASSTCSSRRINLRVHSLTNWSLISRYIAVVSILVAPSLEVTAVKSTATLRLTIYFDQPIKS